VDLSHGVFAFIISAKLPDSTPDISVFLTFTSSETMECSAIINLILTVTEDSDITKVQPINVVYGESVTIE
jgi:hypothetical protein